MSRKRNLAYYHDKAIQPWDVMKDWMTPEQYEGFLRGNVIKYIGRYPDKTDPMGDLYKCQDYLDALINFLESKKVIEVESEGVPFV